MGNARANAKKKKSLPAIATATATATASTNKPQDHEQPPTTPNNKEAKKEEEEEEKIFALKRKKPSPSDFMPESAAFWKEGEHVPFLFLAQAFDLIANESSRIIITDILSNVFRTVIATTPGDLIATIYLSANKIASSIEGMELGIRESSIIEALASAYGGNVSGKDSEVKKQNHISGLLVAASDCEALYIIRLVESNLRIGFAKQSLLMALGQAVVYSERCSTPLSQLHYSVEEATKIIKQVYSAIPIYDVIVSALLSGGVWKLSKTCSFIPGIPISPMLAKPTIGVSEILDKFKNTEFTCECKYDGERAQIHYMDDGSVEIFSRNAQRNTGKFPDVVKSVQSFRKSSVRSFVLDCEMVAYDRANNKILPFQVLRTRPHKEVEMSKIRVQVRIYAFDILYLNGQSLLQEQLKARREEIPGEFQFATTVTSNDFEEIQKFLEAAVNDSCEGLIVKTLNKEATYDPAKHSNNWLKLKKDYMDSLGDSLDLVLIAAFHGRGKRTGVYGAFLLACYNDKDDEYQSICRIGSGFSEDQLEEYTARLHSKVIPKPKSNYRYSDINPGVWFEPTEVWVVKAADLSINSIYHAATGIVDPNKGISLRFPRLEYVREDKSPKQATSSEQVAEMSRSQKINHKQPT